MKIGDVFGRLTVVELLAGSKTTHAKAECKCECGSRKIIRRSHMTSHMISSCGCLRVEATTANKTTHGHTKHPLWHTYKSMIARCHNPKNPHFRNYGARGISVCDRWRMSFDAFVEDVGLRPRGDHQLDRINNDGPYSPQNTRWVIQRENLRNKRTTRRYQSKGQNLTLAEWSSISGVSASAMTKRLRLGWRVDDAIWTPSMSRLHANIINRKEAAE